VLDDKVPEPEVIMNVTISPGTDLPLAVTSAVIVDVMGEFIAKVEGVAVNFRIIGAMVTDVDLDEASKVAVIMAVPAVVPGLSVTVAIPFESVVALSELKVPSVVENNTWAFGASKPITSRIVAVMVDVMVEFAAITFGVADRTICASLTSTASKGIVCP